MKTILVVLAIAAFASALPNQKMSACVLLVANTRSKNFIGSFQVSQDNPRANVLITGSIGEIKPALYVIGLHKKAAGNVDCNTLGPLEKSSSGHPLYLGTVKVKAVENEKCDVTPAKSITLAPNQPNSVIGHTVALYNSAAFNPNTPHIAIYSVACGHMYSLLIISFYDEQRPYVTDHDHTG